MISASNIQVRLGDQTIFRNLSFVIRPGEKVALTGESGVGKTTLLKTIIGWHPVDRGEIHVDRLLLDSANLQDIRKKIFFMPQEIHPAGDETVSEYLSYPFKLAVNKKLHFRIEDALERFQQLQLADTLLDRPLQDLSGGERKRVGIVRGLLLGRPVFLLDEPTAGVDGPNRTRVMDLLLWDQDLTLLAITHDDEFVHRSERHLVLENLRVSERQ